MQRLILLGLFIAMVLPAHAGKHLTVAQLEQTLAADFAGHRSDDQIAHKLDDLELSERLTGTALDGLGASLSPGPKTALALELLADRSAFLDPPASELPATASPDPATQQRMLQTARGYAVQTLSRLPNFFATLTTYRFDDSPQSPAPGEWPVRIGMRAIGSSSREITFRDGRDSRDPAEASAGGKQTEQSVGLTTRGEFGSILVLMLIDTAKGKMTWSHWEQPPSGLVGVFHYSVPKSASHYAVSYCCIVQQQMIEGPSAGGRGRRSGMGPQILSTQSAAGDSHPFRETPAYHGTLSIDPASGAILRITLEAELNPGDPLLRAATMIEYGPVPIGNRSFICPVRSLALTMAESGSDGSASREPGDTTVSRNQAADEAWANPASRPTFKPVLHLNKTTFTRYHRLGTELRILADGTATATPALEASIAPGTAPSGTSAPGAPGATPAASAAAETEPPPPSPQTSATPAASNALPAEPVKTSEAAAQPATPPAAQPPAIQEISLSAAGDLPSEPANPPQAQDGSSPPRLASRMVDVGVVAFDKKGHAVLDLKSDELEIFDNGHKQQIRFFAQVAGQPSPASAPEFAFSNRTAGPLAAPVSSSAATILLIDNRHVAGADLARIRPQMLQFLAALPPAERVGLYTMNGLSFHVLQEITTDHAALVAHLQNWIPAADPTPDDANSIDPQLLSLRGNPAGASLILLAGVARHLSAVPGHKNVVWISTDNVFADRQKEKGSIDQGSTPIESFALRAQEAMNEAHASVYLCDVSQPESGAIDASLQRRNAEPAQPSADRGGMRGNAIEQDVIPDRTPAEMHQNTRPIQKPIWEPLRQVAEATGGRDLRHPANPAAELAGVVQDGHAAYLVSFSPQGEPDGQYHVLSVKVASRGGVTLRYRTGYLFQKEPAALKDRFQQALWQPMDASEIAVTANSVAVNPGANLKIGISAADLALNQQAGRWMDKLDIFFVQRDDAGLHPLIDGQTLALRLKFSTYQNLLQSGVPFEHFVQLQPGMASLRVVVVDENSGRIGSVTLPALALGGGQ
jgi:VWFA-related protein